MLSLVFEDQATLNPETAYLYMSTVIAYNYGYTLDYIDTLSYVQTAALLGSLSVQAQMMKRAQSKK